MAYSFDIKLFLNNLPNLPGVYRMLDKKDQVLYVGKAKNLKNRVLQYFNNKNHSYSISLMIKQINHIDITVTNNEIEALILENNLIKALSPKYNILFRDDKSYPYLCFTNHNYPRMLYYRGSLKKGNRYFGPYPNSYAVKETISVLQKIFMIRTCNDTMFKNRNRPCLLYQIKRCSAPCLKFISENDYKINIEQSIKLIEGNGKDILELYTKKMEEAASKLEFEEAARIRDKIQLISIIQSQQTINSNEQNIIKKNIHIIEIAYYQGIICIQLIVILFGKYIDDKSFFLENIDDVDLDTILEYFIAQHYLGKPKPDMIIVGTLLSDSIKQALKMESKNIEIKEKIKIKKIAEKNWLDLAKKNASLAIEQKITQIQIQENRKKELSKILNLPKIERIECFDISHTFGESTIASCVVYFNNQMQNKEYRRFNIYSTNKGDDYIAIKEALRKKYRKNTLKNSIMVYPDLVLIDGGKGQVSAAIEVWKELNLNIPLLGIAKGPSRKVGEEELVYPRNNANKYQIIKLHHNNIALHLLQTIRDEAHRFAITGHRNKRDKNRIKSSLDNIPGIGAKRKKNLLLKFGSVEHLKSVSINEIAKVEGISKSLAKVIYENLQL